MTVELGPAIRSLIIADADVVSKINTRCFSDILAQNALMPAVTYTVVSETAQDCLFGFPLGTDSAQVQIDCYGKTRSDSDELWQMVRKAIAGFRGVIANVHIKSVSQATGRHYMTDRPEAGTDQWRFRSVQDFNFVYQSIEA